MYVTRCQYLSYTYHMTQVLLPSSATEQTKLKIVFKKRRTCLDRQIFFKQDSETLNKKKNLEIWPC